MVPREQDRDGLSVLVVSPVRLLRDALAASLKARLAGGSVATSDGGGAIRDALAEGGYDVVLVDTACPLHAETARALAELPARTRLLTIGRPPAEAGLREAARRCSGTIRRDIAPEALLELLRARPAERPGRTSVGGAEQSLLLTSLLRKWGERRRT